jgi:putative restriction endonuclease
MQRAWSCIALGDNRQYAGNTGYDDELKSKYSYDSNVANHRNVSKGDLIVLRDGRRALGLARVEEIVTSKDTKPIRRCPVCRTTGLKLRVKKQPAWRCSNGHEFGKPLEADEPITKYVALFGGTFAPIKSPISAAQLKSAAVRPSDQLSIEELGLGGLERLLNKADAKSLGMVLAAGFLRSPASDEADENSNADGVFSNADEREKILRAIKVRRGQSAFRRGLIKRYGGHCMVTGCEIQALLEAAHIAPYRNDTHNALNNGLLLRADIHTLFDLYLMRIDPQTLTVTFDQSMTDAEYAAYHGTQLKIGMKRPSVACLKLRADLLSKLDAPGSYPDQIAHAVPSKAVVSA